jgi:hypothetical protein
MAGSKAEQSSRYRSMQVLLFVFSMIFFSIIAYGYFYLFVRSGWFLAFIGGLIVAVFAWYLARVIGTSPGGIRKHWVLLVPLFIVSAAGVYNSLMLYLEGDQILTDAASESQTQFVTLQRSAERKLAETGVTARINRVRSLSEALYSEIRNPLNCGQGQEARRLIEQLQRELPGFTPLSSAGQDCGRNNEIIEDYRQRIDPLIQRAEWNSPELGQVVARATEARRQLDQLRATAATNYNPLLLQQSLSEFERQDGVYRNLRQELERHEVDVRDVPPGLHISEVRSLGNAFKLPALIIERLDQPVTIIYLLIALGFDLFMVHCFQLVMANRVRRADASGSLAGAW